MICRLRRNFCVRWICAVICAVLVYFLLFLYPLTQWSTLDRQCSNVTNICYLVKDMRVSFGLLDTYPLYDRFLMVEGLNEGAETAVQLLPPNDSISLDASRHWHLDHSFLSTEYASAMFAMSFAVGAFSLRRDKKEEKSVLMIGLGGGGLDMYIRGKMHNVNMTTVELDPTVAYIAHRWFGVVNDERRRTVVGDGIEYMKNAVEKGSTFDVLMLDACDPDSSILCPATPFRDTHNVHMMRAAIGKRGLLIVNFMSFGSTAMVEKTIASFASHFSSCVLLRAVTQTNIVLACMPYETSFRDVPLMNSRLSRTIQQYNLFLLQNSAIELVGK